LSPVYIDVSSSTSAWVGCAGVGRGSICGAIPGLGVILVILLNVMGAILVVASIVASGGSLSGGECSELIVCSTTSVCEIGSNTSSELLNISSSIKQVDDRGGIGGDTSSGLNTVTVGIGHCIASSDNISLSTGIGDGCCVSSGDGGLGDGGDAGTNNEAGDVSSIGSSGHCSLADLESGTSLLVIGVKLIGGRDTGDSIQASLRIYGEFSVGGNHYVEACEENS